MKLYPVALIITPLVAVGIGVAAPHRASGAVPCSNTTFAFATFSDNYSGQEGGLKRSLSGMLTINPDVRFIGTAGDTPDYSRVRPIVTSQLAGKLNCGATVFPFFPTTGNHELDNPANLTWWATNWAQNWPAGYATSSLATQMPGVTNFQRGPLSVLADGGASKAIPAGTIYSFDYGDTHFVFVNDYEQFVPAIGDPTAGVYDANGAGVTDPTNSQLDWLQLDLAAAQAKKARFVFGHPALVPIVYSNTNPPPGWSEHNGPFHTADLLRVLADGNVTAYIQGHDHVISRRLMDRVVVGQTGILYTRDWFTLVNDPLRPYGDPSQWSMQGPGKAWQEDTGTVFTNYGSFLIVKVTPVDATFELYHYTNLTEIQLYDSFVFPTP